MKQHKYDLSYLHPSIFTRIKNYFLGIGANRIQYLNLHLISTSETPWLVKLSQQGRLSDYIDYREVK